VRNTCFEKQAPQALGIRPRGFQGGPRRLWGILDGLRGEWLRQGYFQLYGAQVFIPPKGGKVHLARGSWKATISG